MKYITTIIRKLIPKELPIPVGRWRIENCNIQTNQKIDLSNEDHCGPCGQYALDKIKIINDKNDKTNNKNKNAGLDNNVDLEKQN
uniref:Uncharacterized protein n=1 Tax=viral metagenome TaxID=1070528 RepID=A0A6C0AS62_9ZZZZ